MTCYDKFIDFKFLFITSTCRYYCIILALAHTKGRGQSQTNCKEASARLTCIRKMCTNVNIAVEPARGLIAAVHMTTQQKTADKVIALNQRNPKRTGSSLQRVLAELRGPQRLWTTTLAALIASLSPLLGGYTLGFASPALLQLNDDLVPSDYHLDGVVLGLFTVGVLLA